VPDLKSKPNVKAPSSTRGQAADLKPSGMAKQASDIIIAPMKADSGTKTSLSTNQ